MLRSFLKRLRAPGPVAEQPGQPAAVVELAELEAVLSLYVRALSAGSLRIAAGPSGTHSPATDGRTVFLPPALPANPSLEGARRRYRLMAAWTVLQARTGCLELAPLPPEWPAGALAWYELLQGEWVDRRLVREWPGLTPAIADLRWTERVARQARRSASDGLAEQVLHRLLALPLDLPATTAAAGAPSPAPLPGYVWHQLQAVLDGDSPEPLRELALDLTTSAPAIESPLDLPSYRARIRPELLTRRPVFETPDLPDRPASPAAGSRPATRRGDPLVVETRSPAQVPRRARGSSRGGRQAIQLSLGDREAPPTAARLVPLSEAEKAGAALYPEWDCWSGSYLAEWCAVRESRARSGNFELVERILRQHRPLVQHLKQQFEVLRPERLRLTRQLDGDDLDLAAIVEAAADRRAGLSPSEKLYSRTFERERSIALACLVDLSGSTGAWIDDDPRNEQVIEVTRRALIFLCEALSVLEDRYAIFGFTGTTRKQCQIRVIKGFDEPYGTEVKGRIAGLSPGAYTRIGPAIRHVATILARQPARLRLLMLISDGRPNDFDGYGGRYGIEDTRRALLEARQRGLATFALTIDAEARDYMPYMFGPYHYVVIEDVSALALKLAEVYRRLTVR
jgi:nitric oxide reductase NorD protein